MSISNEPSLMIRDRLLEAYDRITFISDNDFSQDANYKRANQVLCTRIRKLEENHDFDEPRLVKDVIPNSNLAKYGQYQYNEAREKSYTTSMNDTLLHYPCLYKLNTVNEPWMLPEVEQIFIHTVFAETYNFKLYEAQLEQLEKLDLLEETLPGLLPTCCTGDFHKVNPVMDHLFERSPGKVFGDVQETKIVTGLPHYFNVQEDGCLLLKKRILSDIVREPWNRPKLENQDIIVEVYKSTLDNACIEESNYKSGNSLKTLDSEKSLQKLIESMLSLSDQIPKSEEPEKQADDLQATPPTRRLYSDVVQGNKSPSKQPDVTSPTLPKLEESCDISFELPKPPSLDSSPVSVVFPAVPDPEEGKVEEEVKASTHGKCTYSEAIGGNASETQVCDFGYDNFRNSSTTSFQSFYNPFPYMQYNANYRLGYTNPAFGAFAASQQMPQRQGLGQQWYFPSFRPPNLCSYGNFLGQLLLPQIPTKHRWSNASPYVRPPTPQNFFQQAQTWCNVQSVYKANANPPTAKPPKAPAKFPETTKAKNGFAKKPKVTKPPSDYKLMTRQMDDQRPSTPDDIPVNSSASDELERIAIREYQSSNDLFFTEIERQAKEQYDGNPENSCCPPNKPHCLGGRAAHTRLSRHVHFFIWRCANGLFIRFKLDISVRLNRTVLIL